ncbi:hypothetical protein [Vampirovibrio sp.]
MTQPPEDFAKLVEIYRLYLRSGGNGDPAGSLGESDMASSLAGAES